MIVVGHSWSGALATTYALAYPEDVAGLVLLAPVTHSWRGGVGTINRLIAAPVIGPLLAHTIVLPSGFALAPIAIASVFSPRSPPAGYRAKAAVDLVLRPHEFIANAQDLTDLKAFVAGQSPRYPQIAAPTVIIASEGDEIVSTEVHSRAIARQVPNAKLIVLPDAGHMVHHTAAESVVREIEALHAPR
jgi:pimeloyl-ACP methyl ester carboxylesterase